MQDSIKSLVERYPIAFKLLPEVITIPQLRSLYEQLLREKINGAGNFWTKIKTLNILEETEGHEMIRAAGPKPTYYKFVGDWRGLK